ncbi:DUF3298 and DUF4163 domain-containing protein [Paenisporosarcina quisquiliarum]|uniref:DUF3298 and DUF4163 domain-containing protein n=1 Tax=Paenisporosarcina quisquiliarum TaxID=365346 RepID=UPI003736E38B
MDFPVMIGHKHIFRHSPKISIYYPYVFGLPNLHAEYQINQKIVSTLNDMVIELGFHDENLIEMVGEFEIKTNERQILSLTLTVYSFTGGAHGMTLVKALSFNVTTGKHYELKDLFLPGSDYVKQFSAIIKPKIAEWEIPILEEFTQIREDQDFYLGDHSLVIYFQLYEISPYVAGFPYFPIPILDIQDIIQPKGPLEILLPF